MLFISSHKRTLPNSRQKFSIIIPSWNNLRYLLLCINSIRKNSVYSHQIIVHVNEGKDGTAEWIKEQQGIDYTFSEENVGVCYALNAAAQLAHTDYILYMNDDMYVCPGWDKALYDEIEKIGHPNFFVSATTIEPVPQSVCSISGNYGTSAENFDEEALLNSFSKLPMQDWIGATWPPNVVHKSIWNLVGGYSIEFSPGMYSDPDFSMKLWQTGIRLFKGVAASRVYHFGSVSVKRIQKNRGYYQFIDKWGMTSSTFTNKYLRRGDEFVGESQEIEKNVALKYKNLYKRVGSSFLGKPY